MALDKVQTNLSVSAHARKYKTAHISISFYLMGSQAIMILSIDSFVLTEAVGGKLAIIVVCTIMMNLPKINGYSFQ